MKSQRNIARLLFGLTLTLVGLMSWKTLPVHFQERTVQAAPRARVTEPTGQPVLRAVANGRIAFVSSEGNARSDIYTMNPDGSNVQRLTNNPAYDQGPKWSPDGTRIAFASSRDDTSVRCTSGGGCYLEIYVMNADGTNQTRTNNPGFDDSFDWSPDSTRIVFERAHDGSIGSISVMNADGSNVQRLTNYAGYDFSPKWSPDGTKIAFLRAGDNFASPSEIYVMNADGTNQTRLINLTGYDSRWSPDGTKIVFVSADIFDASTQEIYVINADGSNVQRLTNNQTGDSNPAWSPDGSKITFIRACQHNRCPTQQPQRLWVVNADGSNPTKLTDTPAWLYAWSPDGTKIIFGNAQDDSAADLFVMNPDGSGLTNITNTTGKYEGSPSWQPLSLPPVVNPIDDPQFFVRQHYLDFLNREPEPSGLAAWMSVLNNCPAGDLACLHEQRLTTSSCFFGSTEFHLKGYFAFRFYRTAFDRLPEYSEISADMQSVTGLTPEDVYSRKAAFTNSFVQRAEFAGLYNGLPNTNYVAALMNRYGLTTITTTDPATPDGVTNVTLTQDHLVSRLDASTLTRAQVLRAIANSNEVFQAEFNRAFVAMQYYGYLRRTPEAGGYNMWLDYLNTHPGDFRKMVRGFVDSTEYRSRFGQP